MLTTAMGIENKRIEDIIKFLIFQGKVKNAGDFATKMKHNKGAISKILGNKLGVTSAVKWKIYETYHINKPYVFEGIGELGFEPTQEIVDEKNELYKLRETVKSQKRTMNAMEKTIKAQEIIIAGLNKQLEELNDSEPVHEKTGAKKIKQMSHKMQKSR